MTSFNVYVFIYSWLSTAAWSTLALPEWLLTDPIAQTADNPSTASGLGAPTVDGETGLPSLPTVAPVEAEEAAKLKITFYFNNKYGKFGDSDNLDRWVADTTDSLTDDPNVEFAVRSSRSVADHMAVLTGAPETEFSTADGLASKLKQLGYEVRIEVNYETRLFKLKHVPAEALLNVALNLWDFDHRISLTTISNSLILRGSPAEIELLTELCDLLDRPPGKGRTSKMAAPVSGKDVFHIALQHIAASDVAAIINRLWVPDQAQAILIGRDNSNAIVMQAEHEFSEEVQALIDQLDQPTSDSKWASRWPTAPPATDDATEEQPNVDEMRRQVAELDQKSVEIASQGPDSESDLDEAVRRAFSARQSLYRAELADLRQHIEVIEQRLAARRVLAEDIIQRRIQDLRRQPSSATDTPDATSERPQTTIRAHSLQRVKASTAYEKIAKLVAGKGATVAVDEAANWLIVMGTREVHDQVAAAIEQLDGVADDFEPQAVVWPEKFSQWLNSTELQLEIEQLSPGEMQYRRGVVNCNGRYRIHLSSPDSPIDLTVAADRFLVKAESENDELARQVSIVARTNVSLQFGQEVQLACDHLQFGVRYTDGKQQLYWQADRNVQLKGPNLVCNCDHAMWEGSKVALKGSVEVVRTNSDGEDEVSYAEETSLDVY